MNDQCREGWTRVAVLGGHTDQMAPCRNAWPPDRDVLVCAGTSVVPYLIVVTYRDEFELPPLKLLQVKFLLKARRPRDRSIPHQRRSTFWRSQNRVALYFLPLRNCSPARMPVSVSQGRPSDQYQWLAPGPLPLPFDSTNPHDITVGDSSDLFVLLA